MSVTNLQELLVDQLRDLYDAEKQLTKALPKMAKAASHPELGNAFREHLEETKGQVSRLEQVFELLGVRAKGKPCEAMKGLVAEGRETMEEEMEDHLMDPAIVVAARKVEHYEMAGYESMIACARALKLDEVANLLQETLREETAADKKLALLARNLLKTAASGKTEEEEEATPSVRRATGNGSAAAKKSGTKGSVTSASARSGSGNSRASASPAKTSRGGTTPPAKSGSGSRHGASAQAESEHLSHTSIDHEEIRRWAEARGGRPACVQGTGGSGDTGMIRIEFPGTPRANDSNLQEISWDDFFEKFDGSGLALVYQEHTAIGEPSNFNKLIKREEQARPKVKRAH